jgi:uncharacterized membrane protein YkvA (DUF1232 family)
MNESTGSAICDESGNTLLWRQQAHRLKKEVQVFYFAFRHPRAPWYARLVAACIAGYVLSPIQLIPSFIPVIGFLDDLLILFVGANLPRTFLANAVSAVRAPKCGGSMK